MYCMKIMVSCLRKHPIIKCILIFLLPFQMPLQYTVGVIVRIKLTTVTRLLKNEDLTSMFAAPKGEYKY